MAKSNFYINPTTLALEREKRGFIYWLRRSGLYVLEGIVIGLLFFYLYFSFFPSPTEKRLIEQRNNMEAQLDILQEKQAQMDLVLEDLRQRDENLYRVLFGAEPIPFEVRSGLAHRMSYYEQVARTSNSDLLRQVMESSDSIEAKLYIQAKSLDEITDMARNQEIRMQNIPAIQPVLNKDMKRVASGYGVRIDPIYHIKKFHHGMDFSAPVGTEIYATGNGRVIYAGWKQGYGNTVVIDHGYGYTTVYAHCYKAVARKGQRVKRGDIIALVGNSGKSTGPHLHYEVRIKDKPVDPRNYYFYDLSPEEYDMMVQLSNNQGNMLD